MTLINEIIVIAVCVSIAAGGMLIATKRKQEIMWSICVLAMTATILAVVGTENGHLYPATMVVIHINESEDLVTVETAEGHTYQFHGAEDYAPLDAVSIIMDSNGTEDITDDKIVKVQYSGFKKGGK